MNLTPVEEIDGVWVKRDDLFEVAGAGGGKARTIWSIVEHCPIGIVTVGSRHSLQINVAARIAAHLKIPFRAHCPSGELSEELNEVTELGGKVIQHYPGYNSVIIARARVDAATHKMVYVPFGLECFQAVKETKPQVENIPTETKRMVVPVGSGMSLCGILQGLRDRGRQLPVIGLVVGANPSERLNQYAPKNWRSMVRFVRSNYKYQEPYIKNVFGNISLDPYYEAKCIPYLKKGDCLWVVGCRKERKTENGVV